MNLHTLYDMDCLSSSCLQSNALFENADFTDLVDSHLTTGSRQIWLV